MVIYLYYLHDCVDIFQCDVRFPKQRDLVAEDDVDDSDDEDFSVISTLSSISKRLLYFLTDKECFHSPKKHPK